MKIIFKYDINKDVENIIKTSKAKNDSSLTQTQLKYVERYGDRFEPEKVKEFIHLISDGAKTNNTLLSIQKGWLGIEKRFVEKTEQLFNITYPYPEVTAYLSHNERCGYNIDENYFFVNVNSKFPTKTIMHELLHFYTWHAFGDIGNDLKESLTELLNIEFKEVMGDAVDNGYPQHREMRKKVGQIWSETRDLKKIIERLK
jgi:hypothetical protein